MIGSKYYFRFGAFAFAMGAIYLGAATVFQIRGIRGAGDFVMIALPWLALGVLASWAGRSFLEHSQRLDKIESQLGKSP
jgi:hypothetical protein